MPLDPDATYAPTPLGLTRQMCDLIDEIVARLDGETDLYRAKERVDHDEFYDLVEWMSLEDPLGYLRRVFGDIYADWWEEHIGPQPLRWPVQEALLSMVPEVALGGRHVELQFAGMEEWAQLGPSLDVIVAREDLAHAKLSVIMMEEGEPVCGELLEGWIHDQRRWVRGGRPIGLEGRREVIDAMEQALEHVSFGDLRACLQRPPSAHAWQRTSMLLYGLMERPDFEDQLLPYVRDHVKAWPRGLKKGVMVPWADVLEVIMVEEEGVRGLGALRPPGLMIDASELPALLEHPVARTLDALYIIGETLSLEAAEVLARLPMPNLTSLLLKFESWEERVSARLVRAPWRTQLQELHILHRAGAGWPALLEGLTLNAASWPSWEADVSSLLEGLGQVRSLRAVGPGGVRALEAIVGAPEPLQLEELYLAGGISEEALLRLSEADNVPRLRVLHVSSSQHVARASRALARSAKMPALEILMVG